MSNGRKRVRIAASIREALTAGRVDASGIARAAGLNPGSFRMAIREQSAHTYRLEEWVPAIADAFETKAIELARAAERLRRLAER